MASRTGPPSGHRSFASPGLLARRGAKLQCATAPGDATQREDLGERGFKDGGIHGLIVG